MAGFELGQEPLGGLRTGFVVVVVALELFLFLLALAWLLLRGGNDGDQLVPGFVAGSQVAEARGMAFGQVFHGPDQFPGPNRGNHGLGFVFLWWFVGTDGLVSGTNSSLCRPGVQDGVKDNPIEDRNTGVRAILHDIAAAAAVGCGSVCLVLHLPRTGPTARMVEGVFHGPVQDRFRPQGLPTPGPMAVL